MHTVLLLLVGFVLGVVTTVLYSALIMAGRADERMEKMFSTTRNIL